ncbi:hypothetical protein [Cohnella pontilimi]|nr:hypothetical protein [Cohnella pontilimi]
MTQDAIGIRGKVVIEVFDPGNELVSRTVAFNTVVDGGRALIAKLMSGEAKEPSFAIVAGISEKENSPDLTELYEPDGIEPLRVERVKSDSGNVVLSGSFKEADKDRQIREAGLELICLVDGTEFKTLYNRVRLKEATPVRKGQVLSMNWMLSFAQATE